MSTLASQIKAVNYWQTFVRPGTLNPNRITNKLLVPEMLSKISVEWRGWDFPHVDFQTQPIVGEGQIGQETNWEYFRELWLVTESGQFAHVAANRYDCGAPRQLGVREKVGSSERIFGMLEGIWRMAEIFEFADRYGNMFAKGEGVTVAIEIGNLKGYRLVVDAPNALGFSSPKTALSSDLFSLENSLAPATPGTELRKMAAAATQKLFERFNFRMDEATLQDWQSKLTRGAL